MYISNAVQMEIQILIYFVTIKNSLYLYSLYCSSAYVVL